MVAYKLLDFLFLWLEPKSTQCNLKVLQIYHTLTVGVEQIECLLYLGLLDLSEFLLIALRLVLFLASWPGLTGYLLGELLNGLGWLSVLYSLGNRMG